MRHKETESEILVQDVNDSEIVSTADKEASKSENKSLDISKQNEALTKLVV